MVKLKLTQPRCWFPTQQSLTATAPAPSIASSAAPPAIPAVPAAPKSNSIEGNKLQAAVPQVPLLPPIPPVAPKVQLPDTVNPALTSNRPAIAPNGQFRAIAHGLATPRQHIALGPREAAWSNSLSSLSELHKTKPMAWYTLVGLYFMESGRTPNQIVTGYQGRKLAEVWRKDILRLDMRDRNSHINDGRWRLDNADQMVVSIGRQIAEDGFKCQIFEEGVRLWASHPQNDIIVASVLERADWTQSNSVCSAEWMVMDKILTMENGEEKNRLLEQAQREAPRVYSACLDQVWCGVRRIVGEHQTQDDEHSTPTRPVYNYRKRGSLEFEEFSVSESRHKRPKMDDPFGRPTQVHGVPLEDRASDSKGNKLPWGLEWHEDHPNARGQKRHVEEKGPFGKSNRRKGSSRTRTATPARKENPTIDGFEKALSFTLTQELQSQQGTPSSRVHNDGSIAAQHSMSANKQPTQIIIFGYSLESQWAALDFYEKGSYGMICEDYAREPPTGAKRFPSTFSSPHSRRPLTKPEKTMVFKYDGGESWVKVTLDSAEAAERAIELSPVQIYGHWVYAQLYRGIGPERDEPIPVQEGERGLRQPRPKPQTVGPSYTQRGNPQQESGATLPRSFAPSAHAPPDQSHDTSPSSSTATSGTATGVEYPDLRQRNVPQPTDANQPDQTQNNPRMMRHFPDTPRTVLRPASEAFLPQQTWWERQVKWMSEMGLIPGEVIGSGIPLLDDGRPDLGKASFYWRFFYWIDSHFGTDFCGLKDDE